MVVYILVDLTREWGFVGGIVIDAFFPPPPPPPPPTFSLFDPTILPPKVVGKAPLCLLWDFCLPRAFMGGSFEVPPAFALLLRLSLSAKTDCGGALWMTLVSASTSRAMVGI